VLQQAAVERGDKFVTRIGSLSYQMRGGFFMAPMLARLAPQFKWQAKCGLAVPR
jgi:hypothetical protein